MLKRSELSATEQTVLAKMVGDVFAGTMVVIEAAGDGKKYLCFRCEGEALPDAPLAEACEADASGVFLTGESYGPGGRPGGEIKKRHWLGAGSLDELLLTLGELGSVRQILGRYQHGRAVWAAVGSGDRPQVIDVTAAEDWLEPTLSFSDACVLADAEYESYDFGAVVEDADGWSGVNEAGAGVHEISRKVYLSWPGAESSVAVNFTVRFDGLSVSDAYALTEKGGEVGLRTLQRDHGDRERSGG